MHQEHIADDMESLIDEDQEKTDKDPKQDIDQIS
jgi:hypothetical protein